MVGICSLHLPPSLSVDFAIKATLYFRMSILFNQIPSRKKQFISYCLYCKTDLSLMDEHNSTRKFLIATHGTLAAGIKSSLDIIIGSIEHVFLLQAYVDEQTSVEAELEKILTQVTEHDELVVLTDILGGSITNQILQHCLRPNVYVVSGVNLPLVIDVMLADAATPIEEVISTAIENAKEQMVFVNKLLTGQNEETAND
jgi:fructoselysine/glucoselysine PTS system EIIA component